MKLGVISQNFMMYGFDEGLDRAREMGFKAMEVGACGLWGAGFLPRSSTVRVHRSPVRRGP